MAKRVVIDNIIYKFIPHNIEKEEEKEVIDEFKYKFIINNTPKYPNYFNWFREYELDLTYMYNIFTNSIENRFDTKDANLNFEMFCKFIYNNSSKYIRV